ncbi:HK97 family phage prohead protease [Methylocystis sp. SB2]|uniref:HK97 family phage prohead protease n=1 Tax=Methylocystis sp. (strain SB2) TaxID=743836 RepID=UPI0003F60B40|nr:HK97 family phage prohead protease [Methylocystis sp. SB2]ULO22978.1 HK97 family phage prohead protease [Methylocystis sp. SB2]
MRKSVYETTICAPRRAVTKFVGNAIIGNAKVGDRQIRVVVSTPTPDRVGDVMEPMGCDLTAYRKNPICLRDHNRTQPIGTATVDVSAERVDALITFAPEGVSEDADEVCALVKAGVVSAVSPGFIPMETAPLKGGGMHVKKWQLLEISIVTVPCNADAVILERTLDPEAARRRREIEILRLKTGANDFLAPPPSLDSAKREREIDQLRAVRKQQERDVRTLAMSSPVSAAHLIREEEEARAVDMSRRIFSKE